MKVLFASTEISPLAKTGGLGEVAAALPAALSVQGIDIRLVMPGYTCAMDHARAKFVCRLPSFMGVDDISLFSAHTPDTGLPLWLVDSPSLFRRSGGAYVDADRREWPDNFLRFAAFSHAVAALACGVRPWRPDIVHVNDWHLGLVPALLAARGADEPGSVLTIHNLAFQGTYPAEFFPQLGLPSHMSDTDGLEFHGGISLLKAGIRYADRLTTVSPRYAREILTPEYGCGLDGVLRSRADVLVGILNGIDHERWTPADPVAVPHPYSADDVSGKKLCKLALQRELNLPPSADAPVVGFISRLTEQKMADVLPAVVPAIAAQGAQFVLCGEGDPSIEDHLRKLAAGNPDQVSVRTSYDESTTKRILAGADILAAPARFEPCGLAQMYGMRFGALPVVRHTGGLADTVVDVTADKEGTGFSFDSPTAADFRSAIEKACSIFRSPDEWGRIQTTAMRQDFGWRRSARRYSDLYRSLIASRTPGYELSAAAAPASAEAA